MATIGQLRPDILPRILAVSPAPPGQDPANIPARGSYRLTLSNPCGHSKVVNLGKSSRALLSAWPGSCPTCPPPGRSFTDTDPAAATYVLDPDPSLVYPSYKGSLTLSCAVCGDAFETVGPITRAQHSARWCPAPGCRQVASHASHGGHRNNPELPITTVSDAGGELLRLYQAGGGTDQTRNLIDPASVSASSVLVKMWMRCPLGHVSRREIRTIARNIDNDLEPCLTCRWNITPDPTTGVFPAKRVWDPTAPELQHH